MEREEAIEKVREMKLSPGKDAELIIALHTLIPELRESEDERIRKWILEKVQEYADSSIPCSDEIQMVNNALAYLEKQKEQKSADEQFPPLEGLDAIKAKYYDNGFKNGFDEGVASVKPEDRFEEAREKYQVEWSDEDEEIFNNIIEKAKGGHWIEVNEITWLINRFKSLRPVKQELSEDVKKTLDKVSHILIGLNYTQVAKDYKQAIEKLLYSRPSWKPSEEQRMALINCIIGNDYDTHALTHLSAELKKL